MVKKLTTTEEENQQHYMAYFVNEMVDKHDEEWRQFENIVPLDNTAIPPIQNSDMPSTSKTVTLAQVLAKLEQIEVNHAVLKKENEGMEEKIKAILALLTKNRTDGRFKIFQQLF